MEIVGKSWAKYFRVLEFCEDVFRRKTENAVQAVLTTRGLLF